MTDTPRKFQVGDTVKILSLGPDAENVPGAPYEVGDVGIIAQLEDLNEEIPGYIGRLVVPYRLIRHDINDGGGWWVRADEIELVRANSDA